MKMSITTTAIIAALLIVSPFVLRGNELITNPGPGLWGVSAGNNTLGYDFTIGSSSVIATGLGLWDANEDGFVNSHSIGLWSMSGDLLASVTVPSGTATELANQFEFVSLSTPVNLLAGQSYVLGASFLNDDGDYFIVNFGGNQAGFDSAIVPGDIRYIQDGGFTFPSSDDVFGSEIGPNVEFTVVPEPSSALLMLVFSAAILLARLVGRVTRRKVKIL